MVVVRLFSPKTRKRDCTARCGATLVLFTLVLPVALLLIAISIDLARFGYVRGQLQSAADAGAIAGASCLRFTGSELEILNYSLEGVDFHLLRPTVQSIVAANSVGKLGPAPRTNFVVQENASNAVTGDIVIGQYSITTGFTNTETDANAVRVTTRFNSGHPNGMCFFLFQSLLPIDSVDTQAVATARVERPTLLPFLIYEPQWDWLMAGNGVDNFSVDPENHSVASGPDGIPETAVFPNDWDGLKMPPGNFGWFDIGPDSDHGTLIRQIDSGPNENDMSYFGGVLSAGDSVSGTTGFRASTEVALVGGTFQGTTYKGIIGQPRLIALYNHASGQGSKARFQISKFVMARVVHANMSGSGKGIVIQPLTPDEDPNRVRLVE